MSLKYLRAYTLQGATALSPLSGVAWAQVVSGVRISQDKRKLINSAWLEHGWTISYEKTISWIVVWFRGAVSEGLPSRQQWTAAGAAGGADCWPGLMPGWEMSTSSWIPDKHLICCGHMWRRITGTRSPGTFSSKGNSTCCCFHLSLSHFLAFARSLMTFSVQHLFWTRSFQRPSCFYVGDHGSALHLHLKYQNIRALSWQQRGMRPSHLTLCDLADGAWTDVQSRTLAGWLTCH